MTPTKISAAGLDLIKSFEGYHRALPDGSCVAYKCPAGVWTLGWGCTVGIKAGMVWTKAQAEAALRREMATFEEAVSRLVTVPMSQNEYDALVSFAYNCGTGALERSTILRKLNAGDREGASAGFKLWTKGGGRVLPGLVRRRDAEAALFLTPVDDDDEPAQPSMPQCVEPVREPPKPATVATVGAAGGTAIGTVVNSIPPAPDLTAALGWQGFAQTLAGLSGFVTSRPLLVLAVLAVVAGVWLLPKWRQA